MKMLIIENIDLLTKQEEEKMVKQLKSFGVAFRMTTDTLRWKMEE